MQSERQETLLNKNLKLIFILAIALIIIFLIVFRNLFFQPIYLLKSFGESSLDPEIAFSNNKPTFLEFYAEWCEVCKEMAPKISNLKEEYEKDINFVFLNVDNQRWNKYIRKFDVNGIPQVNLFDREGNLTSTFIGKQEEIQIKEYVANLKNEANANEVILNQDFSSIKQNKNNLVNARSHG